MLTWNNCQKMSRAKTVNVVSYVYNIELIFINQEVSFGNRSMLDRIGIAAIATYLMT